MSYTPPPGGAADFSWVGVAPYAAPSGDAADFSWSPSGHVAAGFLVTKAGTPSTPASATGLLASKFGTPSLAFTASGVLVTQYGTPDTYGYYKASGLGVVAKFGTPQRDMVADGFMAATVGFPSTPTKAQGEALTQYGTPRGYEFWQQRSLPPTTKIPSAFSPVDVSGAASGWLCTQVGSPTCIVVNVQAVHYLTAAVGFLAARFGAPSTPTAATGRAEGFLTTHYGMADAILPMFGVITRYGVPVSRTTYFATGWSSTAFGAAASRQVGAAQSVRVTAIGAPTGRAGYTAASLAPVRFGKHHSNQTGVSAAYSLGCITRVPRPRGWSTFNYQAGGSMWTAFGTPTCTQAHRALHTPVSTRFGTPTLRRSNLC